MASYSAVLETWPIPQLRERGLLDDVWLQHHWAPAHFALFVRDVLNEHFTGRWIVRGSPTSPAPLPWPPHSPDLTTPDNSLWGIIKGRVAASRYNNNNEICAELWKTPFAQILQKCSNVCHRRHGGASLWVSSIKVHIRIHWTYNQGVRDSNQIMVAYWSVYGDFSSSLYMFRLL